MINPTDGDILIRVVNDRIVVTTADAMEHDFPAQVLGGPILFRIVGGANQTDKLTADLRGLPTGTLIDFDAHGDAGDELHTLGGGPNLMVVHETATADGFRGSVTDGKGRISFGGIKPLTLLDATPEQVTVNLPPVTDHALLQRLTDGNGQFQVLSPSGTFEQTLVEIPSVMFMLNAGDGDDLVELTDDTGLTLDQPVMVHGNEGNDTFDSRLFPHLVTLFGDLGDDVFQFSIPMFDKLEGGDGMDAVELVGEGAELI